MKVSIIMHKPEIPDFVLNRLYLLGDIEIIDGLNLSEKDLGKHLINSNILICAISGCSFIGKSVLDKANKLEYISVVGSGIERIDVNEVEKRGIKISTTKGSNSEAVAEHIRGMILNLSKRISELERLTRLTGENDVLKFQGKNCYKKTIGVIGLGEIGKKVVRIAKAFDMRVLGNNKDKAKIKGLKNSSLEDIYTNSDIIVISMPLTKDTTDFISYNEIKLMKKGVIIINCSREEITNKKAIIEGIKEGKIYGFGLETDMYQEIKPSDAYFKYPQILLTPHNAWNTEESEQNSRNMVIRNLNSFLSDYGKNRKQIESI